jgi:hypothetical protein
MQDITAYVIVSVAHYLVVVVGFGLVAFLIYHDKRWIPMLVATCLSRCFVRVPTAAGHMLHAPCADMNS